MAAMAVVLNMGMIGIAEADGEGSVAVGKGADGSANQSIAVGAGAAASANQSIAIGSYSTVDGRNYNGDWNRLFKERGIKKKNIEC